MLFIFKGSACSVIFSISILEQEKQGLSRLFPERTSLILGGCIKWENKSIAFNSKSCDQKSSEIDQFIAICKIFELLSFISLIFQNLFNIYSQAGIHHFIEHFQCLVNAEDHLFWSFTGLPYTTSHAHGSWKWGRAESTCHSPLRPSRERALPLRAPRLTAEKARNSMEEVTEIGK